MPDENELYERWRRNTDTEEREDIERRLFRAALKHAKTYLFLNFPDFERECPGLPQEIAEDAIRALFKFRQQSKFSTFVEGIAKNKRKMVFRSLKRRREALGTPIAISDIRDAEAEQRQTVQLPSIEPDAEFIAGINELQATFSESEKQTFRAIYEGKDQKEIATEHGISAEAADSRRQRLKKKIRKNLPKPRRLQPTSGN